MRTLKSGLFALLGASLLSPSIHAQGAIDSMAHAPFFNFETGPVQPLLFDATNKLLMVLNTPDNHVEFFSVQPNGSFLWAGSVLTGLEPISMAHDPTTNRLFVANHVSDSVTVIDVWTREVIAIIQVGDEPTDVALVDSDPSPSVTNLVLWVSCTRAHQTHPVTFTTAGPRQYDEQAVALFQATPPFAHIQNQTVGAHKPRRVIADGTGAIVMPQNSGNKTVIVEDVVLDALGVAPFDNTVTSGGVTVNLDPAPHTFNPFFAALNALGTLPPGWKTPRTSRIVTDSERNALLSALTTTPPGGTPPALTLADLDLVRFNGSASSTGQWHGAMTTQLNMARRPNSQEIWIVGQDAKNRARFEPSLNGVAIDNMVSIVDTTSSLSAPSRIPLTPATNAAGAQPVAIGFYSGPLGEQAFIACLGTSNILAINPSLFAAGGAGSTQSVNVELPIGLTVDSTNNQLFVLSRQDHSVHVFQINAVGTAPTFLQKVPLTYNPEPEAIFTGRRHLYDARSTTLHGANSMSCASCHIYGDLDQMAWDLGKPEGGIEIGHPNFMQTGAAVIDIGVSAVNHPMKGPMMTQTLRGLGDGQAFHWRGDRPFFHMFQGAFGGLLGAPNNPSTGPVLGLSDMQEFAGFGRSLIHSPNPYQPFDRTFVGNAGLGKTHFTGQAYNNAGLKCSDCHQADFVTDFSGHRPEEINDGGRQFFNTPQLRGIYEKEFRHLTGFGIAHDGRIASLRDFLDAVDGANNDVFNLFSPPDRDEATALLKQWDPGLAPSVGASIFINLNNVASQLPSLAAFEQRAIAGDVDLIARGRFGATWIGLFFDTSVNPPVYCVDDPGKSIVPQNMIGPMLSITGANPALTFVCVPPGTGVRIGVDKDEDGAWNGVEIAWGIDLSDPDTDNDGYDDGYELANGSQPGNGANIPTDGVAPTMTLAVNDIFHSSASLHIALSEAANVSVSLATLAGAPIGVVSGTRKARVHDLVLQGLPAADSIVCSVTAIDTSNNSGSGSITFQTEIPHYHVEDITITGPPSGSTLHTGQITIFDHNGSPAPAGFHVHIAWVEGGIAVQAGALVVGAGGVATTTRNTTHPAPALCVGAVGSTTIADPDWVGFGVDGPPGFPAKIFYDASANKKSYAP